MVQHSGSVVLRQAELLKVTFAWCADPGVHIFQTACSDDAAAMQMTTSEHGAQLATFLRMCSNEERNLEEGEIDKTFTCPLTLDIFMDPVLALSGVSYERNAIHDWLQVVFATP